MDIIESTAVGFAATSCDPNLVLMTRGEKGILGSHKKIVVVLTAEGGG